MTDAITRPLAVLMAALHPGFDIPGCASAIHEARHLAPPDQLAHAVIAYATRTDVRTPALLAQDGPHWHTGRTPDVRIKPARCQVEGHERELAHNCSICITDARGGIDVADPPTLSPEQRARNRAGAALVLAARVVPTARCLDTDCDWATTGVGTDRAAERHTKHTGHGTCVESVPETNHERTPA
jgi:hypothetical protein